MPRSNQDLINTSGNQRVHTALRHLGFSTATCPLTDGNKMRLQHLGSAMNRTFSSLTVFHTHNYADNYSPEILKMQSPDPPVVPYVQNVVMPTLQQMHRRTAKSPRSTAKLFLLMEELSYRHLYKVDRAWLGNFKIQAATGWKNREDDFASNGLRGLADFATALFKCIESQARGFAHGHGKIHSIPDGAYCLLRCLEAVVAEINEMEPPASGGQHPTEQAVMEPAAGVQRALRTSLKEQRVEEIAKEKQAAHNEALMASATTRQYESAVLPAKQVGLTLPPVPFSEKQQRQSRYDGGMEEDGVTERKTVHCKAAAPPAHIRQDRLRENQDQQHRNTYKQVPLTACQLCIAPNYLLPHSFGQNLKLGDEGEIDDSDVEELPGLPWKFDPVTGELQHFFKDMRGNIAETADFQQDAVVFEKCFGLDVRFLHHHNHDHECSGTCVKNVKKKTKEELAKMLKSSRAPPCRFEFWHIKQLQIKGKNVRIRRRGKDIVEDPFIINSTARNQLGSVALERPQPFASASSDCGLATMRCNNDYKYMAKGFPTQCDLSQAFHCDASQLAACFRSMKAAIKAHRAVRHMAMTVVALHVAAKIIDYYITKYAAKPMEQLQNLVTQYALGLRRLELEEAEAAKQITGAKAEAEAKADAKPKAGAASNVTQPLATVTDWKARGRQVVLKLQYSANRAKWISSTESALYTSPGHVRNVAAL